MGAPRRVIALPSDAKQRQRLVEISRSRTEPTSRVERARIILAYLEGPSAYAVARTIGVTQQTVTRCLERAAELGVIEALDDRPRAGRDPVIWTPPSNPHPHLLPHLVQDAKSNPRLIFRNLYTSYSWEYSFAFDRRRLPRMPQVAASP